MMKKRVLAVLSVCVVLALSACSVKELDDKYGSMTDSELDSVFEKEFGEKAFPDGSVKNDTSSLTASPSDAKDLVSAIEKSEDLDFSYFEIGESKFNIKFDYVDTLTFGSVLGAVEGEEPFDGWGEGVPFKGNTYSTELDKDGKGVKTDSSSLVYLMEGNEVSINFYTKPKDGYPESLPLEIAGVAVALESSGDTDVIFADGVKVGMNISDAEKLITGYEYYGDGVRAYKDRNDISLIMHINDEEIIDRIYLIRYVMPDGKE
jgi:hypothetical protein